MVPKGVIPAVLMMGALAATPAWAGQEHRRGGREQRAEAPRQSAPQAQGRERAVPRQQVRGSQAPRQNQQRYEVQPRQYQAPRAQVAPPRSDVGRGYDRAVPRQYDRRDYDRRNYRGGQPYYGSPRYGYGYGYGHGYIAPRVIRPRIVTVVPYRPYVYRPSWSIGVYYGSNNYYPYGYTPRGYYDPIPGVAYGGLRITGLPRDAQVFADGYYVGIVDDFDGVFQHLNLEAGGHHIEIQLPGGYEAPIAFDVMVRPGETTTYRANIY